MDATNSCPEERFSFLKQKIEALTPENNYLREQNSKLADELDAVKSINENLKDKLSQDITDSAQISRKKSNSNMAIPLEIADHIFKSFAEINEGSKDDKTTPA